LAFGCADLAVLNLVLAPRLAARDMGGLVIAEKAPDAQPVTSRPTPLTPQTAACPPLAAASVQEPPAEAAPDIVYDPSEIKVPGGSAAGEVRRVAGVLAADRGKQLLLRGHTDRLGTPEGNLALSRLRAEAVLRLLAAYGAPADRVTIEAIGDADPADPMDTPTGRARNRRVQLLWR
jgi:OOP family OmpA-OmpF porin